MQQEKPLSPQLWRMWQQREFGWKPLIESCDLTVLMHPKKMFFFSKNWFRILLKWWSDNDIQIR
jgi:hypothetical protein